MTNLLEETISSLKKFEKKESDVKWVGNLEFWVTWESFKKIAITSFKQPMGYLEVKKDLLVVGKDFWLERSKCGKWTFTAFPKKPSKQQTLGDVYKTYKDLGCIFEHVIPYAGK